MSHTYAQNVVHVVFSTKDRRKAIDRELRPQLWSYVTGICRKLDIYVHGVGRMEDHIHLLIQIRACVVFFGVIPNPVALFANGGEGSAFGFGGSLLWVVRGPT